MAQTGYIYKLYFEQAPEKVYIGSTTNFKQRIKNHFYSLINRQHPIPHLQKDFNIHSILYLRWEILEEVQIKNVDELLEYENKYIAEFKSAIHGYNAAYSATRKRKRVKSNAIKETVIETKSTINEIIKNKIFHVHKISSGLFKKDNDMKFSSNWYNNVPLELLKQMFLNVYSDLKNNAVSSRKKTMIVLPQFFTIKRISEALDHSVSTRDLIPQLNKMINEPATKKGEIDQIYLLSCLNPLHTDTQDMSEEDVEIYKIFNFLRYIPQNSSNELHLYVPEQFYDLYDKYLVKKDGDILSKIDVIEVEEY